MKEFKFKIGGQDYAATVEDLKDGQMKVTVNGQTYQVEVPHKKAEGPHVAMAPAAPAAQTGGTKNVCSELPGTVTKINVAGGQHVKRGEVLLVAFAPWPDSLSELRQQPHLPLKVLQTFLLKARLEGRYDLRQHPGSIYTELRL